MSDDASDVVEAGARGHGQASGADGASAAEGATTPDGDGVAGIDRTQQYLLIAAVGFALVVAGAAGVPTGYSALVLGVGLVVVAYGVIGGTWDRVAGTLDLDQRTRIWILLGVTAVLLVGNTVIGDLLGENVGLAAFGIGLICLIYGGGLAISHYTD